MAGCLDVGCWAGGLGWAGRWCTVAGGAGVAVPDREHGRGGGLPGKPGLGPWAARILTKT